MKVTAILPDSLVEEVQHITQGKNITESLISALKEWLDLRHIKELNERIQEKPLEFKEGFSSDSLRELNRKRAT
jgi:hypothetical protein